jgi:hypothetical protein
MYYYCYFFIVIPQYNYVGAIYFTLANIDPALHSKLEAINLVALFKSSLLAEYSLNDVLKPFVDDLKKLSAVSCLSIMYGVYLCLRTIYKLGPVHA